MNYYGVLVDATTGNAVEGATISIDGVAVSNTLANGQFSVTGNAAEFALTFSKIGYYTIAYKSTDLASSPGATLEILPGSAETLEPVIVTPQMKWILGTAAVATLLYYTYKK